jgi:hypothetical protein
MMGFMASVERVLLLGCVKLKHTRSLPAQDLYRSPLWVRRRAYAESRGYPWMTLSAKHGLVDPKQPLAPYDLALTDLRAEAQRRWGERVVSALRTRFGSLSAITFEVHAGAAYRRAIEPGLVAEGARLVAPLAGLALRAQLAWYTSHAEPEDPGDRSGQRRRLCTPAEVGRAVRALAVEPVRTPAWDWPGQLTCVAQPGLYSSWVDRDGARELSTGLGHDVSAGLVYPGQTGATKWPSGKQGKATLASRIGANHLRGRIQGSTFRLTLAACLAAPLQLHRTDHKHLAPESEQRLTHWMFEHLKIAVMPFPERDALADLEHHLLAELDPPLNLEGGGPTPIRHTLSRLRGTGHE